MTLIQLYISQQIEINLFYDQFKFTFYLMLCMGIKRTLSPSHRLLFVHTVIQLKMFLFGINQQSLAHSLEYNTIQRITIVFKNKQTINSDIVHVMIFFHLGWLYDVTGSYNTSFYGIGTVLVVGGVLLSLIPVVQNLSSKEPSLSSSTSRQ